MIRQQLDTDLKAAMLGGDSVRVDTIRGLKSTILYADVAAKKRDSGGIPDAEILTLLGKEAKKRQESADLYIQGGSQERADKELTEKAIIEGYLPEQLSAEALAKVVDEVIAEQATTDAQVLGRVIGAVKARVGGTADGGAIAQLVKERLGT